ncbi:gamma-glutamyl-gamma-aminobutyrate hydrolase family protein [Candidatus Saccharibacteria bacterium]|nr:gamma-glutamyl-gamma-aminobutyrate hydrolase family protein [Candidatus Saccharibacteria bacterium]
MKILLINNNTRHLENLQKSLVGHEIEIQMYKPELEFHDQDKDLVILSGGGGEGLEIDDKIDRGRLWYEDEMEFALRTKKPLIGICMGFEVICRAYGRDIPKMDKLLLRQTQLSTTQKGRALFATSKLSQYEAHQWHVTEAPAGFEVLADSAFGIEIIKKGNIFAAQFHPEKPGSLDLSMIISDLVA